MTTILESLKYTDATIHGGDPQDVDLAQDWTDNGFTSGEECEPWWEVGCFDAGSAAALRAAGIVPSAVAPAHAAFGTTASIGYWHSNGDISLDEVKQLIGS